MASHLWLSARNVKFQNCHLNNVNKIRVPNGLGKQWGNIRISNGQNVSMNCSLSLIHSEWAKVGSFRVWIFLFKRIILEPIPRMGQAIPIKQWLQCKCTRWCSLVSIKGDSLQNQSSLLYVVTSKKHTTCPKNVSSILDPPITLFGPDSWDVGPLPNAQRLKCPSMEKWFFSQLVLQAKLVQSICKRVWNPHSHTHRISKGSEPWWVSGWVGSLSWAFSVGAFRQCCYDIPLSSFKVRIWWKKIKHPSIKLTRFIHKGTKGTTVSFRPTWNTNWSISNIMDRNEARENGNTWAAESFCWSRSIEWNQICSDTPKCNPRSDRQLLNGSQRWPKSLGPLIPTPIGVFGTRRGNIRYQTRRERVERYANCVGYDSTLEIVCGNKKEKLLWITSTRVLINLVLSRTTKNGQV